MVEEAKMAAGIDISKPLASLVSMEPWRGTTCVVVQLSSPNSDPNSDQNM